MLYPLSYEGGALRRVTDARPPNRTRTSARAYTKVLFSNSGASP